MTAARCVWLFLPAGVANTTPPLFTRFLGPGRPISNRWFGAHKTWQGFIGGVACGVITFWLQRFFDPTLHFTPALAMSAGALTGDLAKSFAKRRIGVKPGKSWFPFDQIDYIIGALIATMPLIRLTLIEALITLAAYFVLHLIFAAGGYWMGMKERPI